MSKPGDVIWADGVAWTRDIDNDWSTADRYEPFAKKHLKAFKDFAWLVKDGERILNVNANWRELWDRLHARIAELEAQRDAAEAAKHEDRAGLQSRIAALGTANENKSLVIRTQADQLTEMGDELADAESQLADAIDRIGEMELEAERNALRDISTTSVVDKLAEANKRIVELEAELLDESGNRAWAERLVTVAEANLNELGEGWRHLANNEHLRIAELEQERDRAARAERDAIVELVQKHARLHADNVETYLRDGHYMQAAKQDVASLAVAALAHLIAKRGESDE